MRTVYIKANGGLNNLKPPSPPNEPGIGLPDADHHLLEDEFASSKSVAFQGAKQLSLSEVDLSDPGEV